MITTEAVRDPSELAKLTGRWVDLHAAAAPGSPFEHPAWTETWSRYFVPEGALECVAVWDGGPNGELVGFAPLYRRRVRAGPLRATSIQPIGTGRAEALTEVVQVLTHPDRTSEVIRAVVGHLEALPDWNWLQLSLGPDQGWLVPQWLQDRQRSTVLHRGARPCVVLRPLPAGEGELLHGLKRNVRESVRRAVNRGQRIGGVDTRCDTAPEAIDSSLQALMALHRARAEMPGKVAHGNALDQEHLRQFLAEAVRALAVHGLARVHVARHDGRDVAAQLVLSDGHTDYLSVSGLDPDFWSLSLGTLLVYDALRTAVDLGRIAVNFSTGPDVAKLRWSPTIVTYNDFAVVRGDRRSRWLYGAYAHAALTIRHVQEGRRHRTRVDGGETSTDLSRGSSA